MKCPNVNDPSIRSMINSLVQAHGHQSLTERDFELLALDAELFRAENRHRMDGVKRFYDLFGALPEEMLGTGVSHAAVLLGAKQLNREKRELEKETAKSLGHRKNQDSRRVRNQVNRERLQEHEEKARSEGRPLHRFGPAPSNQVLVSLADHLVRLNPAISVEFVRTGSIKGGAKAMIEGDTYYLDIDRATPTDLLHEHGHMLMAGLKTAHPWQYKQMTVAALSHPKAAGFRQLYPELTEEQLGEEIFVELLAERAAGSLTTGWWDSHGRLFTETVNKGALLIPFAKDGGTYVDSLNGTLAEAIETYAPKLLRDSVKGHRKQLFEYELEGLGIDPAALSAEETEIAKFELETRRFCI